MSELDAMSWHIEDLKEALEAIRDVAVDGSGEPLYSIRTIARAALEGRRLSEGEATAGENGALPDPVAPSENRFPHVNPGEWVQPIRRGYLMKCCGCGLVHRLNFRLVRRGLGRVIQMQAFIADDSRTPCERCGFLCDSNDVYCGGCGNKPR